MIEVEHIAIYGFLVVLSLIISVYGGTIQEASFDENYGVTWGQDHALKLDEGKEIQLSMDRSTGSGFESKNHYGSGFFQMRIKLSGKDTAGVVTAFYLTSKGNKQDEIDFEFLGNRNGKPIMIQTNVITNGQTFREQKFVPWFDPTQDFHAYGILWNPHHIVFYVDNVPIRVFKNINGTSYPSKPMQVLVSLWNGEAWATSGGKAKINWSYAPFKSNFRGFSESACHVGDLSACGSPQYWWNIGKYVELSASEKGAYNNARAKYITYDYCTDHVRFSVIPVECKWNQ